MVKTKLIALLGCLLLLAATTGVRAAEEKSKTFVVLVGVSQYADPQILPRPHAEDDIKGFYDLLTNKDYLGVDADHIRLLAGSDDTSRHASLATKENILNAMRWLGSAPGKNDMVLLVMVVQGAPLGERSCYFATDSTFKGRSKNAVAAAEIA